MEIKLKSGHEIRIRPGMPPCDWASCPCHPDGETVDCDTCPAGSAVAINTLLTRDEAIEWWEQQDIKAEAGG